MHILDVMSVQSLKKKLKGEMQRSLEGTGEKNLRSAVGALPLWQCFVCFAQDPPHLHETLECRGRVYPGSLPPWAGQRWGCATSPWIPQCTLHKGILLKIPPTGLRSQPLSPFFILSSWQPKGAEVGIFQIPNHILFILRAKPPKITVMDRNSNFSMLFQEIYDLNSLTLTFGMLTLFRKPVFHDKFCL